MSARRTPFTDTARSPRRSRRAVRRAAASQDAVLGGPGSVGVRCPSSGQAAVSIRTDGLLPRTSGRRISSASAGARIAKSKQESDSRTPASARGCRGHRTVTADTSLSSNSGATWLTTRSRSCLEGAAPRPLVRRLDSLLLIVRGAASDRCGAAPETSPSVSGYRERGAGVGPGREPWVMAMNFIGCDCDQVS